MPALVSVDLHRKDILCLDLYARTSTECILMPRLVCVDLQSYTIGQIVYQLPALVSADFHRMHSIACTCIRGLPKIVKSPT